MSALATYNARGAMEAGITDVFNATNSLRAAVGLSPVSDTLGSISSAAVAAIVQQRQLSMVKRASAGLRGGLVHYREGLEFGKKTTVSLVKDSIEESYALRIALWRRGFLDASQLLSDAGGGAGLSAITASEPLFTARNEALCLAVRGALEGRREETSKAIESEYQAQIEIVDALIASHEKFEMGAPLDSTHLAAMFDQLTLLVQKIGDPDSDN
jgi:hypothetical protein